MFVDQVQLTPTVCVLREVGYPNLFFSSFFDNSKQQDEMSNSSSNLVYAASMSYVQAKNAVQHFGDTSEANQRALS